MKKTRLAGLQCGEGLRDDRLSRLGTIDQRGRQTVTDRQPRRHSKCRANALRFFIYAGREYGGSRILSRSWSLYERVDTVGDKGKTLKDRYKTFKIAHYYEANLSARV